MNIGTLDFDTRFEYLIIYRRKSDNTINTWTLGTSFRINYMSMMKDDNTEILGVYKKLTDSQIEEIVNQ